MSVKYTKEEINFIKENYLKLSDKEISEVLKTHSEISIATKRKRLGLTRTNRKYSFQDVVNEFLAQNADFKLEYSHTFMPHIDGTDGFFCALMIKK